MQGRWRRVGDFWTLNWFGGRGVTFVNDASDAVVSRINVDYSAENANGISMVFSPLHAQEALDICKELNIHVYQSPKDVNRSSAHTRDFYLNGEFYGGSAYMDSHTCPVILQFMDKFNQRFNTAIFTDELKNELSAIFQAVVNKDLTGRHTMPASVDLSKVNRRKHGQTELTSVLYHQKNPYAKVKQLLVDGYDPKELDEFGDSPLKLAIIKEAPAALMELLLWYGADPLVRQANSRYGTFCSALETARAYHHPEYFTLIANELTPVEKTLSANTPLRIIHSSVNYEAKCVQTHFAFSNNAVIKTAIISMRDITPELREQIYNYFKATFAIPDNTAAAALDAVFAEDFSDDKLVELIYDKDIFIGFNLFELLRPDEKSAVMLLHCAYAYIQPAYRGYGLMVLLTFRPAYGLDLLLDDMKVGAFFTAVHYNSYRMINWKHHPKNQTPDTDKTVRLALTRIFKGNYEYHHEGLTSYVIDQVKVKESKKPAAPARLNERIYRNEILGINNASEDEKQIRSAPVLFFVNPENREKMAQNAENLGMNFSLHTIKLKEAFYSFLIELCKNGKAPSALFQWYANEARKSQASGPDRQRIARL